MSCAHTVSVLQIIVSQNCRCEYTKQILKILQLLNVFNTMINQHEKQVKSQLKLNM